MLLYILITLCFSSTLRAIGDDSFDILTEPHYVEATRISLTSGVIETYKEWKTNISSRIDYNNGAFQSIIDISDDFEYGIKYEIHPQTTEEMNNYMKCESTVGEEYRQITLDTILPVLYSEDLKNITKESVNDEDTLKYYFHILSEDTDKRKTLWAKFFKTSNILIPIRYEEVAYNTWSGALTTHALWNFYNYNLEVDDAAFSTETYNCTESTSLVASKTKNSIFIDPGKDEHVDQIFETFKIKFNRVYAHKKEHAIRREIFKKKLRLIISTNRQNLGYKLSVNKFADRTPEEIKRYQGLQRRPAGKVGNIAFPYNETRIREIVPELPSEYDLRTLGYVTEIKDQGDCGSCWTFGTTAAAEGALARSNGGQLISLSNQALIDCAWPFGVRGCNGGNDNAAYEWMTKYGLPTEAEYGSYESTDDACRINNMTKLYPIRGYTDVTPFSIGSLKVALVNHGPLSVSLHATDAFLLYAGGIFYDTTCNQIELNHEVTLVGYGERDGDTFWILKNSYGPHWGVQGYMLISARDNNCGIATEPTYVNFK